MLKLRRMMYVGWLLPSVFAFGSSLAAPVAAQERDPAGAQALFDQARELSKQGRYNEACPKFFESNRLDPGIGTQFHLAECYEQSGRIATAWATYLDVASVARSSSQLDREKAATKRAILLEPRLPKLVVNVPDANRLPELAVHRDGIAMGAVQWGAPFPVDPGAHELTVTAPGHKTFHLTVLLEEAKTVAFEVPALEVETTPSEVAPIVAQEAPPAAEAAPPSKPEQPALAAPSAPMPMERKSNVDAMPAVLGAAGVVGLAVGTIFALKAQSTNKQSKDDCEQADMNICGATGLRLRNDALTQGNVATVGTLSGGALLIAAAIVWRVEATSNKSAKASTASLRASAAIAPGTAALFLRGGF